MKLNEIKQLPLFPDIHIEPLNWDEIELIRPGEDIHEVAQANLAGDDYEILKLGMYNVWELLGGVGKDHYESNPQEKKRVQELANAIRKNKKFAPIIVGIDDIEGEDDQPYIIEGQHRARAVQLLGAKTIPAYGIEYFETE